MRRSTAICVCALYESVSSVGDQSAEPGDLATIERKRVEGRQPPVGAGRGLGKGATDRALGHFEPPTQGNEVNGSEVTAYAGAE